MRSSACFHSTPSSSRRRRSTPGSRARGYFSVANGAALKQLGFSAAQSTLVPALVIPLWDVHGSVTLHQARPDRPGTATGSRSSTKARTAGRWRSTSTLRPGDGSVTCPVR